MHELAYKDAIGLGLEPCLYRTEILSTMGEGVYPGELDALVWGQFGRPAHLQAFVTLDNDVMIRLAAYHRNNRNGQPPYLGFREFCPGDLVNVVVKIGPRGGVKAWMEKRE